MTWSEWAQLIAAVLAGVATAIPLVVKLVELAGNIKREKNWKQMLDLVMALMDDAEVMFTDGADKKQWVLAGVMELSGVVDYDIDLDALSHMIDKLCIFSKRVNAPVGEVADE